ncbi:myoD family inhibitor-like [Hippocampus comes]|uniref:myoD family inhibitor-like n=1 Tax=Hippocampus comes TaxID=109280 RepID=UPI00094EC054|nr:PREDICTED: myoD family inhibitor-like [Hippocampus comes]
MPGSATFQRRAEDPPVTMLTDLIDTQPQRGSALPQASSAVRDSTPRVTRAATRPHCGPAVPNDGVVSRSSGQARDSHSAADSKPRAATPADSCAHLLLACLSCQCSVLLLALLEACASGSLSLCACCCGACTRCCGALHQAPVEELACHAHCHSVLFQSCGESTECLEFCMECCRICHRN